MRDEWNSNTRRHTSWGAPAPGSDAPHELRGCGKRDNTFFDFPSFVISWVASNRGRPWAEPSWNPATLPATNRARPLRPWHLRAVCRRSLVLPGSASPPPLLHPTRPKHVAPNTHPAECDPAERMPFAHVHRFNQSSALQICIGHVGCHRAGRCLVPSGPAHTVYSLTRDFRVVYSALSVNAHVRRRRVRRHVRRPRSGTMSERPWRCENRESSARHWPTRPSWPTHGFVPTLAPSTRCSRCGRRPSTI